MLLPRGPPFPRPAPRKMLNVHIVDKGKPITEFVK
jgi:hypothetical protein